MGHDVTRSSPATNPGNNAELPKASFEDVLEEYRTFSRRRIPTDRESAEYHRFDEDLSVMLYRLRQFVGIALGALA